MRSRAPFVLLVSTLAAVLSVVAAPRADAGRSSHPYFDDGGTLTWYRRFDDAARAARAEGKLVFVEYGRRICGSCKQLVSTVLPDPRVRSRLSRVAVGLAADCDQPEPFLARLFQREQPSARMLPLVAFLTPDGGYVTGFSGGCDADRLLAHVRHAEAMLPARADPVPAPEPHVVPRVRPRLPVPAVDPSLHASTPTRSATPAPAPVPAVRPTPAVRGELASRDETLVRRPTRDDVAPPAIPALTGSPDGSDATESGCGLPAHFHRPPGPLPPPQVRLVGPTKVTAPRTRERSRSPAPRATPVARPDVRDLAARGAWRDVLKLSATSPDDPELRHLTTRAHEWANTRLDEAAAAAKEARFKDALEAIEQVIDQMPGEPEYVDGARGLTAIKTLLELRFLNADGEVAHAVRERARDDLRGTRWVTLF